MRYKGKKRNDRPRDLLLPHREPTFMHDRTVRCSRRKFLTQAAALTLAGGLAPADGAASSPPGAFRTRPVRPGLEGRKPLAILATVYRPLSDAYHLGARFLHGYTRAGQHHVPAHHVASVFIDQAPENDVSRELAREFGFRQTRNVAEALTLGTGRLAVDGVLLIAEHGNYPRNERGQILYPRYELLEQVVTVFRQTGTSVPVFVDKHLSHSGAHAREMLNWSESVPFPLMAGSSLPLTWRNPEWELPLGAAVREALVAGYGPIEVNGFHTLEALQMLVERRHGGETGVRAVTCLTGKEVWKAGDAGLWNWDLLEAALSRSETLNPGDVRRNVGAFGVGGAPPTPATAFLVEYFDGTRGTALLLNGHVQDFTVAVQIQGESISQSSLLVALPPPGVGHLDCLVGQIETFLETRQSPTPVERTLLTTCALEAAMESRHRRGQRIETPDLRGTYAVSAESPFARRSGVAR